VGTRESYLSPKCPNWFWGPMRSPIQWIWVFFPVGGWGWGVKQLLKISSWYRLILHLSKIDISIVIARIHLQIYRAFLIVYLMFWEQAISTW